MNLFFIAELHSWNFKIISNWFMEFIISSCQYFIVVLVEITRNYYYKEEKYFDLYLKFAL